ncbi:MAG: hypothetical protein IKL10_09265 [Clostridia bacterium]|nr:hypothetical protein [Clostridia bacterium]
MFIISYYLLNSGFSDKTRKRLHKYLLRLFGLSGNCSEAVIIGLTGGYNTAIKSAVKLSEDGKISKTEAKRLALFFTCPGLSFCINVTGIAVYSNIKVGVQLFISNILTCVIFGFLYNLRNKNNNQYIEANTQKQSSPFVMSVASASSSIISVCSWIILFSAAISGLSAVFGNIKILNTFFSLFGEISGAVIFASENFSFAITAFCLNFGGFCIFLQQLPDITALEIKPRNYLIIRLFQAAVCAGIQQLISFLFPIFVSVYSEPIRIKLFSSSAVGSFTLLLLSIVLIVSVRDNLTDKKPTQYKRFLQ